MNGIRAKANGEKVVFGDVVGLCRTRSRNPQDDGFERYIGLEHLDPGELKVRRWASVADGTTFTNVFRPGQVLFGKRRAYQRKIAVADFSGVCSSDIYVFEPRDGASASRAASLPLPDQRVLRFCDWYFGRLAVAPNILGQPCELRVHPAAARRATAYCGGSSCG